MAVGAQGEAEDRPELVGEVGVVAVDEQTAEDALKKIVVKYEKLPHLVNERDLSKAGYRAKPA